MNKEKNGFVLITSLLIFVLLSGIGILGLILTNIDISISGNFRAMKEAFWSAEGAAAYGHHIALDIHNHQNMNNHYSYVYTPSSWKIYFFSNGEIKDQNDNIINIGSFNQTHLKYKGIIEMIVDSSGYVMCFGDHDDNAATPNINFWALPSERSRGLPYYRIKCKGWTKNNTSLQKIKIIVCPLSLFIYPNGALIYNDDLVSNGNPQSAIGEGHPFDPNICGAYDIISTKDTINYNGNDGICGTNPCQTGSPNFLINADPYPIDDVVSYLIKHGTHKIETSSINNPTFGTSDADENEIYYRIGDLSINNLDGYGILVVKGNLTLSGLIAWNGIIFVTGDIILNGGGNMGTYIHGSVVAGGSVTGNGNPDIFYDCARIQRLFKKHVKYIRTQWIHDHSIDYDPNDMTFI